MILMLFWKKYIFDWKTLAPKDLGSQDPTEKLAKWVELLGQLLGLSYKNVFENLGAEPPLSIWTTAEESIKKYWKT